MSRRIDRRLFLASTLSGAVLTWTGIPSGLFGSEEGEKSQAPWPWIEKELVGQIPIGPNNLRNSEGDFIRLKNGDILYIYTHYYGKGGDDNDTAYLASRRSTDDGKSWTTEDKVEVSDDEAKLNVMSVTCRRLQSGEIALFYLVKDSSVDCRPYMRLSTDEGETWGERVLCVADPSYNVVNNDRIIQLEKSGRIVIPVGRHPVNGSGNLEWKADVFCLYSDDNGKTWNRGETVANPRSVLYQEPGVCELADGRILMFIRNDAKSQFFAYSSDGGVTWTEPEPSELDSPLSPALIKRIPNSDDLLAVWNPIVTWDPRVEDRPFGKLFRSGMNIARLSPDGKEIKVRKTLEDPERAGTNWQYPSILFLNDKEILVAYNSGWVNIYRMSLDDLDRID